MKNIFMKFIMGGINYTFIFKIWGSLMKNEIFVVVEIPTSVNNKIKKIFFFDLKLMTMMMMMSLSKAQKNMKIKINWKKTNQNVGDLHSYKYYTLYSTQWSSESEIYNLITIFLVFEMHMKVMAYADDHDRDACMYNEILNNNKKIYRIIIIIWLNILP